jgi:L-rhamnose isomerase
MCAGALNRVHIGLDYFDASINQIAAWVIGSSNALQALLTALLEPHQMLNLLEAEGDYSSCLALLEDLKAMPASAVWDYYCQQKGVRVGMDFMRVV